MKLNMKNPVVATGFAGLLAMSIAGCSMSSSSTTTVETSTTDGSGVTTTTTQTTTSSSGNGSSTTTETTSLAYTNDYYGVGLELPSGFTISDLSGLEETGAVKTVYTATDDSQDIMIVQVVTGVTSMEGITDEASWANAEAAEAKKNAEAAGVTDMQVNIVPATIGKNLNVTCVQTQFTDTSGTSIYQNFMYKLDSEGDGLVIALTATSPDKLKSMTDCLVELAKK